MNDDVYIDEAFKLSSFYVMRLLKLLSNGHRYKDKLTALYTAILLHAFGIFNI